MAISTNPIRKPHTFGQMLTALPDGNYMLRKDAGSSLSEDFFMPAHKVRDELKALFGVCDTDRIGTDIWDTWHPLPASEKYNDHKRDAEVARMEAEARAARAELERDRERERTAAFLHFNSPEERRRRQIEAEADLLVAAGEALGSLFSGRRRR